MRLTGIVRDAWIDENPPLSQTIELVLRVDEAGPERVETLIVPSDLLLSDPSLEPSSIKGRGFEAEVEPGLDGRHLVRFVRFEDAGLMRHEPG